METPFAPRARELDLPQHLGSPAIRGDPDVDVTSVGTGLHNEMIVE